MRRLLSSLLITAALLICAAPAGAQGEIEKADWIVQDPSEHERPMRVDLMVNAGLIDWFHVGLSGWFVLPVLQDGFLPGINDQFDLEFGTYFNWHNWWGPCSYNWFRLTPMVGVRWMFHLLNELSIYANLKVGAGLGFGATSSCGAAAGTPWLHNFATLAGLGLNWQLAEGIDLRVELNNHGAHAGVSFHL